MKITITQLHPHLQRTLARVYLITGDEPLLVQEAEDAIREAARLAGHSERIRIATDSTDWPNTLHSAIHSLSLLSPKRVIELDLRTVRLTPTHTKSLAEVTGALPPDVVLMILAKRPDAKGTPAWQLACEKTGVSLGIWPIKGDQLPAWILQRAKQRGLPLSLASARWLAEQTEGNLLAAAQELDKLVLWQGDVPATEAGVDQSLREMITDSARYDIFQLANAIKANDSVRAQRVLSRLLLAGTEPVLILWLIARECRSLPNPAQWLSEAARIDRIIKGAEKGNASNEMQALLLRMTGKPFPVTRDTFPQATP